MDNLQCTFKESYASHLKDEVKANISLDKYGQTEFVYDRTKVKQIANLYEPKQLLEKLLETNNDFDAAVILYEAYKNLSPLLASTEAFWVYLTHVDLFKYVQYRHPVEKAKNIQFTSDSFLCIIRKMRYCAPNCGLLRNHPTTKP